MTEQEKRLCLKCGWLGTDWTSTPNGKHHGLHNQPRTDRECHYFAQPLPTKADDEGETPDRIHAPACQLDTDHKGPCVADFGRGEEVLVETDA